MPSLATRRLISAAATLGPADRALLNLWVNRGLGDDALARLTGLTPQALDGRRRHAVTCLSDELGLPPEHVRSALDEIAAGASAAAPGSPFADSLGAVARALERRFDSAGPEHAGAGGAEPSASRGNGGATGHDARARVAAAVAANGAGPAEAIPVPSPGAPATNGRVHDAPVTTALAPPPISFAAPALSPPGGGGTETAAPIRRRATVSAIAIVILAIAVLAMIVILAIALGSGGGRRSAPRPPARAPNAAFSNPTSAISTSTLPRRSPTPATASLTPDGRPATFGPLPGGLVGARGSAQLLGPAGRLKLRLTVSGLPAVRGGGYVAWLYDSIEDSQALGPVAPVRGTELFTLPADAARYSFIDISFQPTGDANPSGASKLRAPNPARTTVVTALAAAHRRRASTAGARRRRPRARRHLRRDFRRRRSSSTSK